MKTLEQKHYESFGILFCIFFVLLLTAFAGEAAYFLSSDYLFSSAEMCVWLIPTAVIYLVAVFTLQWVYHLDLKKTQCKYCAYDLSYKADVYSCPECGEKT